jgi:uncharacterized protein YbjT (DUF2867 family)
MALPASRPLQQVALRDYARLAVLAFERRNEFLGRRLDVASFELTGAEVAAALTRVIGRPIRYVEVPLADVRATSEDSALMFEWFDRVGYSVDIPGLRHTYPEVEWSTFEGWARSQDWSAAVEPAAR